MITQLQTVEIYLPDLAVPIYSLEDAPVAPVDHCVKVASHNATTEWSPSGDIKQTMRHGMVKLWRARPTLADAIKLSNGSSTESKGLFVQLRSDGSVILKDGVTYYWGPKKSGSPTMGTIYYSHECFDGERVINDESDCVCETAVPIGEGRYSFWS